MLEEVSIHKYKKVLVIDDTDIDRLLADKIIKKYDFAEEVVLMESADEMLEYLNEYKLQEHSAPELIFLDINMPEIDGWEFLERFDLLDKKIKDKFKILIVSSSTNPRDKERAFSNKYVIDFITKPLSRDTILRLHAEIESKIYQRTQILTEALNKERELSQLKSRFISIASHEFRTPLSVILSSINLMSKYKTSEDQEKRDEHIDRIKTSVKILTEILNDFLSVSKIEEGKVQIKYSDFDIRELTTMVISELYSAPTKNQSIEYTHTGAVNARLDISLYRLILINLISNAVKYSYENSLIKVDTSIDDQQIVLTVTDSGIGISKENREHLFDLFFRGDNAMHIQGTGIGLHIVAKYTELMNGTIQCKSELEVGTQFIISFPLQS